MNQVTDFSIFYTLIFLLVFQSSLFFVDGIQTGPPIRNLIKPTGNARKQGIYLADYQDYSVILNLKENNAQADVANTEVEEGEFFVRAPNNYALMVVIQFLRFRTRFQGPSLKKLDEICRDYIKLSDSRSKETAEICGYLYLRDNNILPEKLLGPRTFYSANGEVNLKLFIDKSNLDDDTVVWNTVQIIFTAVTECSGNDGISTSGQLLRPCYPNTTITNDNVPKANCISSSLFCDDFYHCGFEGQLVGTDELDCVTNNSNINGKFQGLNNNGGSVSVLMIFCIIIGITIVLVFIGAYVVSEFNISLSSCPPRSRLEHANSNTRISKAAEVDVSTSTSSRTPSNYSSFTPEETR